MKAAPSTYYGKLVAVTGGGEAAAIRAGTSVARPVFSLIKEKLRPSTSSAALAIAADELADRVQSDQQRRLDPLRRGSSDVLPLRLVVDSRVSSLRDQAATLADFAGKLGQRPLLHRLVVLGESGAGKTVTVVGLLVSRLAERHLTRNAERADSRVAVRVDASGWDGNRDLPFTGWLVSQLGEHYGVHPRVAKALVEKDYVIPIVDGLDKMDADGTNPVRAKGVLDHLNKPPWDRRAVVIVCCSATFTEIRKRSGYAGLRSATTFTLQPFTPADIAGHLNDYENQFDPDDPAGWAPIIDQINHNPDGPLATALNTPLMLGLAATAMGSSGPNRITPAELASIGDPDVIREVLFDSMIPIAVDWSAAKGAPSYTADDVRVWLTSFAHYLDQQRLQGRDRSGVTLDQIWKLAGPVKCAVLHTIITAVLAAVMLGVLCLLKGTGISDAPFGLLLVSLCPLACSYLANEVKVQAPGFRGISERFAWQVPGRSRWRGGLKRGLVLFAGGSGFVTVVVGIAWLMLPDTPFGAVVRASAPTFAAAAGFAVAGGFVFGFSTTPGERLALGQNPRRLIRDDTEWAIKAALLCGLIFGLFTAPAAMVARPEVGIVGCIRIGLLCAVAIGLCAWLVVGTTTTRHLAASLIFRLDKRFSARPVRFLDWALENRLLSVSGTAYQLYHETYQQWLTSPR